MMNYFFKIFVDLAFELKIALIFILFYSLLCFSTSNLEFENKSMLLGYQYQAREEKMNTDYILSFSLPCCRKFLAKFISSSF